MMNSNEKKNKKYVCVCARGVKRRDAERARTHTILEENYKLFKEKLRLNNVIVSKIMYTSHYSSGIFSTSFVLFGSKCGSLESISTIQKMLLTV